MFWLSPSLEDKTFQMSPSTIFSYFLSDLLVPWSLSHIKFKSGFYYFTFQQQQNTVLHTKIYAPYNCFPDNPGSYFAISSYTGKSCSAVQKSNRVFVRVLLWSYVVMYLSSFSPQNIDLGLFCWKDTQKSICKSNAQLNKTRFLIASCFQSPAGERLHSQWPSINRPKLWRTWPNTQNGSGKGTLYLCFCSKDRQKAVLDVCRLYISAPPEFYIVEKTRKQS